MRSWVETEQERPGQGGAKAKMRGGQKTGNITSR